MARTIEQIACAMADRYDLVPSAALAMSRVFLGQAADVEGVEADPEAVTGSQAEAIGQMLSEPNAIAGEQDRARVAEIAGGLHGWLKGGGADIACMLHDAELLKAMRHAAEDAMSVKDLAEAAGLERGQVLDMLEER